MGWRNTFDSLAELGDDATLYRLVGYADSGGHHSSVFADPEEIRLVIRPWQSDFMRVAEEGQTGQTPGVKVYSKTDHELKRDDRIEYKGQHFRLMNPQYDQLNELQRWDGQTDERQLRLESEVHEDREIHEPDEGFGGY